MLCFRNSFQIPNPICVYRQPKPNQKRPTANTAVPKNRIAKNDQNPAKPATLKVAAKIVRIQTSKKKRKNENSHYHGTKNYDESTKPSKTAATKT